MNRALAMLVPLICASNATAQEAPTVGLLYNTKESHSLTYRCEKNGQLLDCEFTQIAVRRKTSPGELEARLKRGREEFPDFKRELKNQCKDVSLMLDVLEGRKKPPSEPKGQFTATQKQHAIEMVKAMQTVCNSPTEKNLLAVVRIEHAKDMRTCTVSANSYRQAFRLIRDYVAETPTWVVAQDQPEGACGFVNLSRFEPDKVEGVRYPFWRYTARKAVTNPNGEFLGRSCKGFDEAEYLYDWRGEEHALGCEYIQFSVL
jgi:hypothetical protein